MDSSLKWPLIMFPKGTTSPKDQLPVGRKGLSCFKNNFNWGAIFSRRMGLSCPWEQFFLKNKFLNIWEENTRCTLCVNQTIFYTIEKLSKCKYQKWYCIFNLRLWTKSYDEKKFNGRIFKSRLSCLGEQQDLKIKLFIIFRP